MTTFEPDILEDQESVEDVAVYPRCFRCAAAIAHDELLETLIVFLESYRGSHRLGLVVNCPSCGKAIAAFDPFFRKEFAHEPSH